MPEVTMLPPEKAKKLELMRVVVKTYIRYQMARLALMGNKRALRDMMRIQLSDGTEVVKEKWKAKEYKNCEMEPAFDWDLLCDLYDEPIKKAQQSEQKWGRVLGKFCKGIPLYDEFLAPIRGCGGILSAGLITMFDPYRANHISSYWRRAGMDVVRLQPNKDAKKTPEEPFIAYKLTPEMISAGVVGVAPKRRKGQKLHFDPNVRTLIRKVGDCLIREQCDTVFDGVPVKDPKTGEVDERGTRVGVKVHPGSYRALYYEPYKAQQVARWEANGEEDDDGKIVNGCCAHPEARAECEAKRKNKEGIIASPAPCGAHIHARAIRYMMKKFLADMWVWSRKYCGLPVTEPYVVSKGKGELHHDHSQDGLAEVAG